MLITQTIRAAALPRHTHQHAYAAVILAGEYEEAGDQGRFRARSGNVIIHESFESHLNVFPSGHAVVLNIPLKDDSSLRPGMGELSDLDGIVRMIEKKHDCIQQHLVAMCTPASARPADWPDELATELARNPRLSLSEWSYHRGLKPWATSRGFGQVFGISPSTFRARSRARHAWKSIKTGNETLAQIALALGFSDQPHMTRSVRMLTGRPPRAWRATCK